MPGPKAAAERLSQALGDSRRLFNQLTAQAKAASANTSSTLFGMLGGFVGTGAAYAISFYTMAAFGVLAPIMAGAGIVLGVLTYRGSERFKFESRLEMHQKAIEVIRTEIKSLPRNAPQAVRDELWNTYTRLVSSPPTYRSKATGLTRDDTQLKLPPPQKEP